MVAVAVVVVAVVVVVIVVAVAAVEVATVVGAHVAVVAVGDGVLFGIASVTAVVAVVVVVVVVVVGNGCVTDPTLFALSGHETHGPADKLGRGGGGGGNRAFFRKGDFPTVITSRSVFIHSHRASMW